MVRLLLVQILACLSGCRSFSTAPKLRSTRICQVDPLFASSSSSEIFVISFDGAVCETTEWRISQGLDAALATWPHLSINENDTDWIRNKMRALAPVLEARPSLPCEYALLARLLLEEQALDQGYSNGATGKYASKFHPSESTAASPKERRSRRRRPLTVGEISANWGDGGCLAETLLNKYHIDYANPIPVLQETVERLSSEKEYRIPDINSVVCEALEACGGNVIVTVGHESDLRMARACLEQAGLSAHVVSSVTREMLHPNNSSTRKSLQLLIRNSQTIRHILETANPGSTVYVIDSSWPSLQRETTWFGDDGGSSLLAARAVVGDNVYLSLNLPKWADNTQFSQHNDAMMNPWTNLVTEPQFAELASARITQN